MMTDEIDKHVLKKYEIQKKIGKGVRVVVTRVKVGQGSHRDSL